MTEALARAELDRLYAMLPALECKGRCHDSCTAIDCSELERRRLAERGIELPNISPRLQLRLIMAKGEVTRCPALGPLNTCTVYDIRPMICRAFGLTMDPRAPGQFADFRGPMMCDYGCVPDATISPGELNRLLSEIERISRMVTGVRRT